MDFAFDIIYYDFFSLGLLYILQLTIAYPPHMKSLGHAHMHFPVSAQKDVINIMRKDIAPW